MNIPKRIEIRSPIWSTKSIGIAEHRVPPFGYVEVEIMYCEKPGVRMFPDRYAVTMEQLLKYPRQIINSKVALRIIPIKDLQLSPGQSLGAR